MQAVVTPFGQAAVRLAGRMTEAVRGCRTARGLAPCDTSCPGARRKIILPVCRVSGDLLAKLGRLAEARQEFTRAAALTSNERERVVFRTRAAECANPTEEP